MALRLLAPGEAPSRGLERALATQAEARGWDLSPGYALLAFAPATVDGSGVRHLDADLVGPDNRGTPARVAWRDLPTGVEAWWELLPAPRLPASTTIPEVRSLPVRWFPLSLPEVVVRLRTRARVDPSKALARMEDARSAWNARKRGIVHDIQVRADAPPTFEIDLGSASGEALAVLLEALAASVPGGETFELDVGHVPEGEAG